MKWFLGGTRRDVLSKYQVAIFGRTAYERLNGTKCKQQTVEFGGKIHYHDNMKAKPQHDKLGDERFFKGGAQEKGWYSLRGCDSTSAWSSNV